MNQSMSIASVMEGDHIDLKAKEFLLLSMLISSSHRRLEQLFRMNVWNSEIIISMKKNRWTIHFAQISASDKRQFISKQTLFSQAVVPRLPAKELRRLRSEREEKYQLNYQRQPMS